MLATAFVAWWYGAGWKLVQKKVRVRIERTRDSFSVPTLIQTLFAPWKRIITTPGAGINEYFRALLDNTISRFVGFTIRVVVLLSATVCLILVSVAGGLQVILWPLVPLLIIASFVAGVAL